MFLLTHYLSHFRLLSVATIRSFIANPFMSDRKALKEEKKLQKQQKFLQKQTKHVINTPKDRKAHKSAVPIPDIPVGAMKDLSFTPSSFDPLYVEAGWYNWWLKNDFFKPSDATEKFVICIPPPNVTGKLHIGHAMMAAIQDTLVRYHRMTGKSVLYLPGTDHAGIATQAVVERKLLKNGILKNSLTRNEFVQEIFKWKDENGDAIISQLQRLGLSCHFSRQVFTLDKNYSSAVTEAFNILYERKYIYRKEKMVNWCGKMKTTLSDLEVDVKEINANTFIDVDGGKYEFGVMYHFLYPIIRHKEGANEVFFVEVCTTRPETILGDTALCLNPSDKRYDFDGCHAYNFLTKQFIKIVYDDYCDINFGSGIVKITPFHDSNDFEVAQRNGLKGINILNEDNCIDIESLLSTIKEGENAIDNLNLDNMKFDNESKVDKEIFDKDINFLESLHTIKRFEVRKMVVEYLKEKHLLIDKKAHSHALPFCSRSNDIIEPRIKKQWWMDCKDFAEKAKEVVRAKEIKITPSESKKVYFNWLDNIRDWCLSRQLVWGHRIPAYRVYKNKTKIGWVVGRNIDDAIRLGTENEIESDEKNDNKDHNADNKMLSDVCINEDMSGADFTYKDANYKIEQDEDVLDTWFSSALWPFATLGWPDETEDYDKFFSTSLLETGSDILFFWVARMVMLSLELTGKVPFKNILLHGIVRDAHGKKMSKSLGNIIDPIFIIEGRTLKQLNESIANVNEAERKRAASAQAKDFPNGIPCCGTDALRFTLCAYNNGIKDVNLDVLRVEGYRRMGNKIWNAFKFIKMIVESDSPCDEKSKDKNVSCNPNMHIKWITNRLRETRVAMKESYESYNLMNATQVIYSFFLYDFCDVFIEIIKKRKETLDKETAFLVFIDILKMMHPIMPYLTEELYQRLKIVPVAFYNFKQSISIDTFPDSKITDHGELDSKIEDLDISNNAIFIEILEVVKGIRSIVDSHGIKTFVVETDNKAAAYYIGVMIKCDVTVNDNVKGQYVDSVGSIRYGIYDPNHPENEHVDSEDN